MEDVLSLCRGLPERSFAQGEDLLREGGQSGQLLVLIEGEVSIRRQGVTMAHLREPGIFLGEISALLGSPHSATVVADAPTRCHVLDDAASALAQHPELLVGVARLLARRLTALTAYLVDIKRQYGEAEGHLALMDQVLSELVSVQPLVIEPGSAREDQPDY